MEHLNRLRILNYLMAALEGLGLVALLTTMALVGTDPTLEPMEQTILSGVTLGVSALLLLLMGGFLAAASRVGQGRGKILETVLAFATLANFPGMLFGAYALWVMWINPETKAVFAAGGAEA